MAMESAVNETRDRNVEPATMKTKLDRTKTADDTGVPAPNKGAPVDDDKISASPCQQRNPRHSMPIDRGWAWMVLVGTVLQMFLFVGLTKPVGILFVEFQRRFHSNAATTSLLSTVQSAVYSVSSLVVMTVGTKKVSCRILLMVGATLTAIAYIISSRAEDIRIPFFSQGVLQGLGTSCMQPCGIAMVGLYFDKRRGFANSIAVTGGSFGGLVFAPLLTAMFEYYGYSECMLIVAGVYLHGFISGALFRPQTYYTKTQRNGNEAELLLAEVDDIGEIGSEACNVCVDKDNDTDDDCKHTLASKNGVSTPIDEMNMSESKAVSTSRMRSLPEDMEDVHSKHAKVITMRHITEPVTLLLAESKREHYSSYEHIAGSMVDIPLQINEQTAIKTSKTNQNKETRVSLSKSIRTTLANTFDFHVFKIPMFVLFEAAAGILCSASAMTVIYLAPYANDIGIASQEIAQLLIVYGAVDLCSRIVVGYLSDKGFIRKSTLVVISASIMGTTIHLMRFYTNYQLLMFFSVILGVFNGVYFSFWPSIIVDYLTVARLNSCLGFTTLSHGVFMSTSYAMLGYARDVSGSYIVPYHIIGVMQFIGAFLMLLLPLVETAYKRRR